MGWITKTEKPCTHPGKPDSTPYYGYEHTQGDVWECDVCKKHFIVTYRQGYNDPRPGESMPSYLYLAEQA